MFSKEQLLFLADYFSPLYIFKYYYSIISLNFLFILIVTFSNYSFFFNNLNLFTFANFPIYFFITGIILIFHEFGHSTTSLKLGANPSSIGFGFYLISPVMYTDVSDIWKLKRKERNYVNFAGIYTEVFIGMLMSILFLLTYNISFIIINLIIIFSVFINLNPFFRYDGYWILSDSLNIPNLRKVSNQKLKSFCSHFLIGKKFSYSPKNIFLILYSFISLSIIFVFLIYVLIFNYNSIFSFPFDLIRYISQIHENKLSFDDVILFKLLIPALFYFIVVKFIFTLVLKNIKNL